MVVSVSLMTQSAGPGWATAAIGVEEGIAEAVPAGQPAMLSAASASAVPSRRLLLRTVLERATAREKSSCSGTLNPPGLCDGSVWVHVRSVKVTKGLTL